MIWDRRFHALIPRNPIVVRELFRQQRNSSIRRGFIESVGVVVVALCLLVVMLFCVWYIKRKPNSFNDYLVPIQFLAWIFHAATVLRLLAAGTSIIARDGYLLYSDDLRLTLLSNGQLLFGKWWAALHQIRGWLLALGIVQLGIVISAGFGLLMTVDWGTTCNPCVVTIYGLYRNPWFTPTRLILIVASAVGIAILETVCCTTLGMTVALLARNKVGYLYAVSLRFVPVIIFSFFPIYSWAYTEIIWWRYWQYTWFAFADGGTGAIIQMAHPFDEVALSFQRGVLALFAVLGMFVLYLSLSLVTAWVVMRRSRH